MRTKFYAFNDGAPSASRSEVFQSSECFSWNKGSSTAIAPCTRIRASSMRDACQPIKHHSSQGTEYNKPICLLDCIRVNDLSFLKCDRESKASLVLPVYGRDIMQAKECCLLFK